MEIPLLSHSTKTGLPDKWWCNPNRIVLRDESHIHYGCKTLENFDWRLKYPFNANLQTQVYVWVYFRLMPTKKAYFVWWSWTNLHCPTNVNEACLGSLAFQTTVTYTGIQWRRGRNDRNLISASVRGDWHVLSTPFLFSSSRKHPVRILFQAHG